MNGKEKAQLDAAQSHAPSRCRAWHISRVHELCAPHCGRHCCSTVYRSQSMTSGQYVVAPHASVK